jgi:hypothetical protein
LSLAVFFILDNLLWSGRNFERGILHKYAITPLRRHLIGLLRLVYACLGRIDPGIIVPSSDNPQVSLFLICDDHLLTVLATALVLFLMDILLILWYSSKLGRRT